MSHPARRGRNGGSLFPVPPGDASHQRHDVHVVGQALVHNDLGPRDATDALRAKKQQLTRFPIAACGAAFFFVAWGSRVVRCGLGGSLGVGHFRQFGTRRWIRLPHEPRVALGRPSFGSLRRGFCLMPSRRSAEVGETKNAFDRRSSMRLQIELDIYAKNTTTAKNTNMYIYIYIIYM